jgi:hypothetical protein
VTGPALTILYRGPLAGCNCDCSYCPFAKRQESETALAVDRLALERFCQWAAAETHRRLSVFFTPWGEALGRPWYREALIALSHLAHVERVAIQTNLACRVDWLAGGDRQRLALWCTYHPTQVARDGFLARCRQLDEWGFRYSVGLVGLRDFLEEAQSLRRELSAQVYLWVNAYKDVPGYYTEDDIRQWEAIDPYFRLNLSHYPSRGRPCLTGGHVISVDGEGTIRRCHFVRDALGNLYDGGYETSSGAAACPNATCGCHIGYVYLEELGLDAIFGGGILERIPQQPVWRDAAARRAALEFARRAVERAYSRP